MVFQHHFFVPTFIYSAKDKLNGGSPGLVDNGSYLLEICSQLKSFSTPQPNKPLSGRENISHHTGVSAYATPSRRRLTKQHPVAKNDSKITSSPKKIDKSPLNGTKRGDSHTPEKARGESQSEHLDGSLTRRRSRQNVDVFINSLSNENEDIDSDDDGDSEMDVEEVDGAEKISLSSESLIDRESPSSLDLSHQTPSPSKSQSTVIPPRLSRTDSNVGKKLITPTKDERRKKAAALVDLFDDDSEEGEDSDKEGETKVQMEDPLNDVCVRVAAKPVKQRRKVAPTASKGILKRGRNEKGQANKRKTKVTSSGIAGKERAAQHTCKTPAKKNSETSCSTNTATRLTRSQARGKGGEKGRIGQVVAELKPKTRRSVREATTKSSSLREKEKPYRPDDLDGLSSESEWTSSGAESSSSLSSDEDFEEEMDLEVSSMKGRSPLRSLNSDLSGKSRKRASPDPTPSSKVNAKRPKLSLSSRKTVKAEKARKVRTIERRGTPSTARRNGATPTATPGRRRKVITPCIPQRKKVAVGKIVKGSRANQFEEAKQR